MQEALPILERMVLEETDGRIALEAAGVAASLGAQIGEKYIRCLIKSDEDAALKMEAVFILTEIGGSFGLAGLRFVAGSSDFSGQELRQAAVWGMGKCGLRVYEELLPYIDDKEDNVALHAISSFGEDAGDNVVDALIERLHSTNGRQASSASEALRAIGGERVLTRLIDAANKGAEWAFVTIGRLPTNLVGEKLRGSSIAERIGPMLLLGDESRNWLASEERRIDLGFLRKQFVVSG